MLEKPENGRRVLAFIALMAVSLAGLLLVPPIAQDQHFHGFADQRTILGIPHFWNVISNVPFVLVGVAGIRLARGNPAMLVLFVGVLMTGVGSSYYHLDPNDHTLFWDRFPMAVGFMALLALAVEERLDAKVGAVLLWPLVAIGVLSLLVWRWTGDLRLYGWVQFFPCVAIPGMFLLYRPKYSGTSYWLIAVALYALAKFFEFYDSEVYSFGSILSGHTLKHLAAAAACFAILRYYQTRQPIQIASG